jgi:hypothetical protein
MEWLAKPVSESSAHYPKVKGTIPINFADKKYLSSLKAHIHYGKNCAKPVGFKNTKYLL